MFGCTRHACCAIEAENAPKFPTNVLDLTIHLHHFKQLEFLVNVNGVCSQVWPFVWFVFSGIVLIKPPPLYICLNYLKMLLTSMSLVLQQLLGVATFD